MFGVSRHRNETALQKSSTQSTALYWVWTSLVSGVCSPGLDLIKELNPFFSVIVFREAAGLRRKLGTAELWHPPAVQGLLPEQLWWRLCQGLVPELASSAVYFIKNVEMWSAGYRRHLGMETGWAGLILCISKQGTYDSEVNWFLLAFAGFVN